MTSTVALKILHVCPSPSFSGLEMYVLSLCQGQKKLGHHVQLVALPESRLAQEAARTQIEVLPWVSGSKFRAQWNRQTQVIHLHGTQELKLLSPWIQWWHFQRKRQLKVILQTHIWIDHNKRDPWHQLLYSAVDEVWCSSEAAQHQLTQSLPVSSQNIHVIRYGRDIEMMERGWLTREEARRELQLPANALVIGAVGRIDPGKGTKELVEGVLPHLEAHPDLRLLWIGPPTESDPKAVQYAKDLKQQVSHLPVTVQNRLHFPGAIRESFRLLKAFDLFALPSYKECFALALLEAQLAELPVLATRSGGSPDVVKEGETGWLFLPRSAKEVTEAVGRALLTREVWLEYGQRAAARVRHEFSMQDIQARILDQYQKGLLR